MTADAFKFPFQKMLDVKEKQERALQIRLSEADAAILRKQADVERWQDVRRRLLEELRRARSGADLELNAYCTRYLRHVRDQIASLCRQARELEQDRERVRRELEKTLQSRKALENYRDRLRREFLADRERSEERIVELHSISKFSRAKRVS